MTREHYYEDFTVGQIFRSGSYLVTEAAITDFAAKFDPQPQHLSAATAVGTGFGELVASGWHTGAISVRLFISEALPRISGGSQGAGVDRLAWPHPVRPDDVLHVVVEVIAMRASKSRPDRGLVTLRNVTRNQNDQVVMSADHTVMMPRKPETIA